MNACKVVMRLMWPTNVVDVLTAQDSTVYLAGQAGLVYVELMVALAGKATCGAQTSPHLLPCNSVTVFVAFMEVQVLLSAEPQAN